MATSRSPRRTARSRVKSSRETYVFDETTMAELKQVQLALRGANKTKASAWAIQLAAKLTSAASAGNLVCVLDPLKAEVVLVVDVPAPGIDASLAERAQQLKQRLDAAGRGCP